MRRSLLCIGVLACLVAGSHVVANSGAPVSSVGTDTLASAVRSSCPEAGIDVDPPAAVDGPTRRFTDDEFQRIVDLVSDASIVDGGAPPILGDAVADARIRALAEARGYRQRHDVGGGLVWVGGKLLAPDAADAWRSMVASARAGGVTLVLHSGYRSGLRQRQIFVGKLSSRGHGAWSVRSGRADAAIESILRFSSIPGYSRHHTAVVVDIVSPGFGLASFHRSRASRWLSDDNHANAKRHGFVPSYPPGAGAQGPDPEPWEYVFVGVDALVSSTRSARIDRFDVGTDRVIVEGVPVASDDRLQLFADDHLVAEVNGRCSPGGRPGEFRLASALVGAGDLCVVQRSDPVDRLLACRS